MNPKFKLMLTIVALCSSLSAQTLVPDGTPVKLRLNEPLSSGRNKVGQPVSLTVAEDVMIGDTVVIESGSKATGMVTLAEPKRSMGRAGKLDFTPEKVQLRDGRMISLRASEQGYGGKGHGLSTGLVTAGIALVFWPAAPAALLIKGKDVEVPVGTTFTSFIDTRFTFQDKVSLDKAGQGKPEPVVTAPAPVATDTNLGTAMLNIGSSVDGADIEVDGHFVGQTPSIISLNAGIHKLVVKDGDGIWERTVQVTSGTNLNLRAVLQRADLRAASVK